MKRIYDTLKEAKRAHRDIGAKYLISHFEKTGEQISLNSKILTLDNKYYLFLEHVDGDLYVKVNELLDEADKLFNGDQDKEQAYLKEKIDTLLQEYEKGEN